MAIWCRKVIIVILTLLSVYVISVYLFLPRQTSPKIKEQLHHLVQQNHGPFHLNDDTHTSENEDVPKSQAALPTRENILLFWGMKWWEQSIIKYNDPFAKCSKRCKIIQDIKQINKADVLVVQADMELNKNLLKSRRANQIWVHSEFETPENLISASNRAFVQKSVLVNYKRQFNWTMSYRRDADFVVSHGRVKPLDKVNELYIPRLEKLMQTKTKLATWFNSHCGTNGKREKFGNLLKRYMQLDIFGTCGKVLKSCNPSVRHFESFGFSSDGHGRCMDFIDEEYKFYMSFENSLCLDYVTEKSLQRIMPHYIVPVVRTHVNHSLFHPPGSVVDSSNFNNAEKLAKYLRSMDNTTYIKFYDWRKHYSLENMNNMWMESTCRMCERSYEPEKHVRIYEDIHKWIWTPNDRKVCIPAQDLQQ